MGSKRNSDLGSRDCSAPSDATSNGLRDSEPTRRFLYMLVVLLACCGLMLHHLPQFSTRPRNTDDRLRVDIPPPPEPETITVTRLPLPPVAPSSEDGSCTLEINPRRTGCIAKTSGLQSGQFLPDDAHLLAAVDFIGAPSAPDPTSIYQGRQLIIIKTNNETFPNGDAWKCITCGAWGENSHGRHVGLDYPQAFSDGKRALAGTYIIECSDGLASETCGLDRVRIIPLRWDDTEDGSGPGGSMRELRLHPDNIHIGFSSLWANSNGVSQFSFFGRLQYNPSPSAGEPLSPRYDVVNVNILHHEEDSRPVIIDPKDPSQIVINPNALTVGELRGFSGTGNEVTWIGYPIESCNMDVFAADLTSGRIRRLTSHPEAADVSIWPEGHPPLVDLIVTAAVSSVRNNGQRRFFQPWLVDQYGDRGSYFGQKINDAGSGVPGSGAVNDPEWNGRADPRWSRDGTRIAYTQALTQAPACGGNNPLPCYNSTEEGGRNERIMIAHLDDREPLEQRFVYTRPDSIPWARPFPPGSPFPERYNLPAGRYTLKGRVSGWASVSLEADEQTGSLDSVSVYYRDFSDDGLNVLVGSESVSRENPSPFVEQLHWFSSLVQKGPNNGTKITSPGGFHLSIDILHNIFRANGTLTTTANGKEYRQPADET